MIEVGEISAVIREKGDAKGTHKGDAAVRSVVGGLPGRSVAKLGLKQATERSTCKAPRWKRHRQR